MWSQVGLKKHHYEQSKWRWWNSSWAISNPERWCCESAALNMPANLENSQQWPQDWKRSVFIPIPKQLAWPSGGVGFWRLSYNAGSLVVPCKASGGDGIPGELFQILKDDAVNVSKFGKLNSGQRIGKGQFSVQSQRKAMPKNAQTTAQLHSSHTLVK